MPTARPGATTAEAHSEEDMQVENLLGRLVAGASGVDAGRPRRMISSISVVTCSLPFASLAKIKKPTKLDFVSQFYLRRGPFVQLADLMRRTSIPIRSISFGEIPADPGVPSSPIQSQAPACRFSDIRCSTEMCLTLRTWLALGTRAARLCFQPQGLDG